MWRGEHRVLRWRSGLRRKNDPSTDRDTQRDPRRDASCSRSHCRRIPQRPTRARVLRETAKPEHLDDLLATFEKMGEWHPEEPHWYLPIIGVEPNAQGKGLGAALMRHAVARCDQERALAYLESSNPRNISLYLRHGFEVMGEIRVGAAPLVTPMPRQPR